MNTPMPLESLSLPEIGQLINFRCHGVPGRRSERSGHSEVFCFRWTLDLTKPIRLTYNVKRP